MTGLAVVVLITAIIKQQQRLDITFKSKPDFAAGITAMQEGTKVATVGFNYSFKIWN
jgi:hypothetical protein